MTTIYDDIPGAPLAGDGRVLSIGVYDGVHLGHQQVIGRTLDEARRHDAPATLLTFDRLPEELLRPEKAPRRLMSIEEKIDLLAALGPDEIIVAHVKPELLRQEPAEFANGTLCRILRPRSVVVGESFRYGHGAKGTARSLPTDAVECGFDVVIVPPVSARDGPVSSTRIRTLLAEGRVEDAAALLTRPYHLTGRVVEGRRQGRLLGVPTANLEVPEYRLIPANGVYACRARGEGFDRDAAVNIGVRPTMQDERGVTVEAHLLDFDGDLYGAPITLEFRARLREERKFASLDALRAQLQEDLQAARRALGSGKVADSW